MVVHLIVTWLWHWQWNNFECQMPLLNQSAQRMTRKLRVSQTFVHRTVTSWWKIKIITDSLVEHITEESTIDRLFIVFCMRWLFFCAINCRWLQNADNVKMIETFEIMRKWILSVGDVDSQSRLIHFSCFKGKTLLAMRRCDEY